MEITFEKLSSNKVKLGFGIDAPLKVDVKEQ